MKLVVITGREGRREFQASEASFDNGILSIWYNEDNPTFYNVSERYCLAGGESLVIENIPEPKKEVVIMDIEELSSSFAGLVCGAKCKGKIVVVSPDGDKKTYPFDLHGKVASGYTRQLEEK